MFEHVHLSNADYKLSITLLKKKGYTVRTIDSDVIAVNEKMMKILLNKAQIIQ